MKDACMKLGNRVAVVTGAGGGIGRAIALSLARRHCHLALCDIDGAAAAATAGEARAMGVRASVHQIDVANRALVRALPAAVGLVHGKVDLLVNNAGVALGGSFEQVAEDDFDWLMEVNFNAVVRLTRVFLPLLRECDEARIVNLSSIYGIVAPPGQSAYAASKFAVRGFSDALRHELAGGPVGVTVVHPGGVATNIARDARVAPDAPPQEVARGRANAQRLLRLDPAAAGEAIVRGIERRQARVLVGRDARIVALLERLSPVNYWNYLKKATAR